SAILPKGTNHKVMQGKRRCEMLRTGTYFSSGDEPPALNTIFRVAHQRSGRFGRAGLNGEQHARHPIEVAHPDELPARVHIRGEAGEGLVPGLLAAPIK